MTVRFLIDALAREGRTAGTFRCPTCEGGRSGKRSLSITLRDGVYLWLCHRATCDERGATATTGSLEARNTGFQPKPLTDDFRFPRLEWGDPVARQVVAALGIPAGEHEVQGFALRHGLRVLTRDPGTAAWFVKNIAGDYLGMVTRSQSKFMQTYRIVDKPFYAHFPPRDGSNVWKRRVTMIVEDPMSAALLAADGMPAISLLGANLSREAALEISRGDTTYIVALDPDYAGLNATDAVKDRLRALGLQVQVWALRQDVKNMTQTDRRAMIAELAWGPA